MSDTVRGRSRRIDPHRFRRRSHTIATRPQVAASASATRERVGFDAAQLGSLQSDEYDLGSDATAQHCYGTARALGLTLSQTLSSYQAFSQLKEANSAAAAAEATLRGAEENLVLRVAQAYFAILSASDQLTTNRREREAFRVPPRWHRCAKKFRWPRRIRTPPRIGPRRDRRMAEKKGKSDE